MEVGIRVPPAVNLRFERLAHQVCNGARLDYDELPSRAAEIVTWLQNKWREGIDRGLSTDHAFEEAISSFGDRSLAAKSLRTPWHRRLLLHDRSRPDRYLVFFGAYCLYSWLMLSDTYVQFILDSSNDDRAPADEVTDLPHQALLEMMIPTEKGFFLDGLGSYFVGLAAVVTVMLVRWAPSSANPRTHRLLSFRIALLPVAILAILELSIKPLTFTIQYFTYGAATGVMAYFQRFYINWLVSLAHLLAIFLGFAGVTCLLCELFDFHGYLKKRAFQIWVSGGWFAITRKALIVVTATSVIVFAMIWHHNNFPLARFAQQISGADRIVAFELPDREGVPVAGSQVPQVIQAVTSASRDMLTYNNPFHFRYGLRLFSGTNYLGLVWADGSWLKIDAKQYRQVDPRALDSCAFGPAHTNHLKLLP